jgi:hypothetical protein
MNEETPEATFMAEVERLCTADSRLSPLSAGILAGILLDVAHDSRTFSRILGIEHALILREIEMLTELGRLAITRRDERTQRTYYAALQQA